MRHNFSRVKVKKISRHRLKLALFYAIKLTFFIKLLTLNLLLYHTALCGNSSVGRAQPCQGWGREFESRFPLKIFFSVSFSKNCSIRGNSSVGRAHPWQG